MSEFLVAYLSEKMNPAPQISDEEIAYQLQLEDLAEWSQKFTAPECQASTSSQHAYSSSSTRNCSARNSGSLVPTYAITDAEENFLYAFGLLPYVDINRDGSQNSLRGDAIATSTTISREPALEMECGICTDMRPHTSFISTSGCNHEYCSDCCKQHAEVKISGGSSQIECPHQNCRHTYDTQQCSSLLSRKSFEILNTRQTEAAIPFSQKLYCPFKDCSAFMEKSEDNTSREKFVECWSCHRGFCLECNIPWHANKTCGQYRADAENTKLLGDEKLRDLAKQEKWQICTECQRIIELKEGCFHITCLCGNEFCYTCGAKWKNKVATCKCKLWDERNLIRQRMPLFRF